MLKLFVMDVDGTLTDGKIYLTNSGEEMKAFHVKDGYAIHDILKRKKIKTAIITGRKSRLVEMRAKELEIDFCLQGVTVKLEKLTDLMNELGISSREIAYIGDDIPDLECINVCGYTGCPCDAVQEIRNAVDYVCEAAGGEGAIREFAEWCIR